MSPIHIAPPTPLANHMSAAELKAACAAVQALRQEIMEELQRGFVTNVRARCELCGLGYVYSSDYCCELCAHTKYETAYKKWTAIGKNPAMVAQRLSQGKDGFDDGDELVGAVAVKEGEDGHALGNTGSKVRTALGKKLRNTIVKRRN